MHQDQTTKSESSYWFICILWSIKVIRHNRNIKAEENQEYLWRKPRCSNLKTMLSPYLLNIISLKATLLVRTQKYSKGFKGRIKDILKKKWYFKYIFGKHDMKRYAREQLMHNQPPPKFYMQYIADTCSLVDNTCFTTNVTATREPSVLTDSSRDCTNA